MTSDRRFEQDLPALLAELAPRAKPEYRDDIVRQTAGMRQRPAWMFPERWLPMSAITTRGFAAPPVRWRIVALVAVLILALALSLALVAGSRRHVPAPFGPAANGAVAFEKDGDIYTTNPVTGVATSIVADAFQDVKPVFSPDGTHLVFLRKQGTMGRLMVARSDGTGLVTVTPDLIAGLDPFAAAAPQYAFSPDGTKIAFWPVTDSDGTLWIANADGSGVRQLQVPMKVREASWLPPGGGELIVTASTGGGQNGVYAIDPATGRQTRTIVAPNPDAGLDYVRVSPDGTQLSYTASATSAEGPAGYRVHVVDMDGSNNVELPLPPRAVFQDAGTWSNDGTRLAITRGYQQHNEEMAIAVVPADGNGTGVESAHGITGCCDTNLQWSPDDRFVLVMPETLSDSIAKQHLLVNPATGVATPAPWNATDPPAWQRIAP